MHAIQYQTPSLWEASDDKILKQNTKESEKSLPGTTFEFWKIN